MTNSEYEDVQRIIDSQLLTQAMCIAASAKILEELDARGFYTDDMLAPVGLRDKITNIILETIRGNTNYCVGTSEEPVVSDECLAAMDDKINFLQPDGWEGDLQNQS